MKERFIANKNYILRKIAGEEVLVSVGGEIVDFCGVVKLNASAGVLWKTLQRGAAREELVKALVDEFSIAEEQAREDVEASLQVLLERGMVIYE